MATFLRAMGWNPSGRDSGRTLRILEIGSATGFFLDEAKKQGLEGVGVEISEDSVGYARNTLGLEVSHSHFLDWEKPEAHPGFLGIFAFFTLEHIADITRTWEKIDSLLLPGGGIMVALPSFWGPSFQTNPGNWFETHPRDHFYDYSPDSLKKVLKQMGYETKFSKPLSYHPRRDVGWRGKLPKFLYKWIADRQCYGDTFQLIAKKPK